MDEIKNKSTKELIPYILSAGGAVFILLGCFLPFYSLLGISVAFVSTGLAFLLVLVGALGACALAVLEFIKKMPVLRWAVIPGGLALIITFLNMTSSSGLGVGGLSIGAFLMLIGGLAAVAGGVLGFVWKTGQDDQDGGQGGFGGQGGNDTPAE